MANMMDYFCIYQEEGKQIMVTTVCTVIFYFWGQVLVLVMLRLQKPSIFFYDSYAL